MKRQKSHIAAFFARAASFFAQAVSFHLFSMAAVWSGKDRKKNHPCRQQQQPPSWQRAPEESRSQSGTDGPPRGSGGFNTSYRDLLSLHASGRSVNEHLANKPASSESHSLSVDNVNNSAELSKVRSIANVGNTADLNKTSEHLNDGLGRFKRNGWTTTLQIECACAQSEKRKSHLP